MRLFANVLRQLWRAGPREPVATHAERGLLSRTHAILRSEAPVDTPEEAIEYLREEILPLFAEIQQSSDITLAGNLESWVYARLIKPYELPSHYQACFSLMDSPLRNLGQQIAGEKFDTSINLSNGWRPRRWVFFVHNLASGLAHSLLLCDLIRSYLTSNPSRSVDIRLAGLAGNMIAPCFQALREEFNLQITIYPLGIGLYTALLTLAREVNERGNERCIVVAVPTGLSFLTGLLHPERLGWLSMKFEISAFNGLIHRFSFTSGSRALRRVGDTVWWSAPPLFTIKPAIKDGLSLPHEERIASYKTILFTINREEKIRHQQYLEAVSRILNALPDSCFVWTGREALPEINAWFEERGLLDRTYFVGWIDPDALLARGTIFLDTPMLSGSIAAKGILCGIPVLSFSNSQSWVNFFKPRFDQEITEIDDQHVLHDVRSLTEHDLDLECNDVESYVEQAVRLAVNDNLRQQYASAMKAYGEYYFMNSAAYAHMHFANFAVTLPESLCNTSDGQKMFIAAQA